ncbi:CHY zinc finger protein (plasmid) [Arthrobacter sp. Z1-9]
MEVHGKTVDEQTRCVHYRTRKDIIAVKFNCCGNYYPCFRCHEECSDHPVRLWPEDQWQERAILCGVCRTELSIAEYRSSTRCPSCSSEFNEACSSHAHLYFDTSSSVSLS